MNLFFSNICKVYWWVDFFLQQIAIPSRLEKAKQLARKQQNSLKLNLNTPELQIIERDGLLTPLSTSSANSSSPSLISSDSPMSQTPLSPISPKYSPTMPLPTQQPQGTSGLGQPSVFNYYPADMMNNLIPLYLAPYLSNLSSNIPSGKLFIFHKRNLTNKQVSSACRKISIDRLAGYSLLFGT